MAAKPRITGVGSWEAKGTGGGSQASTQGPGWERRYKPVLCWWVEASTWFAPPANQDRPCSTEPGWLPDVNTGSNVATEFVAFPWPPMVDIVSYHKQ